MADAQEPVPHAVLVRMVALGAQLEVAALEALPPDAVDRLLAARVAHRPFVLDA